MSCVFVVVANAMRPPPMSVKKTFHFTHVVFCLICCIFSNCCCFHFFVHFKIRRVKPIFKWSNTTKNTKHHTLFDGPIFTHYIDKTFDTFFDPCVSSYVKSLPVQYIETKPPTILVWFMLSESIALQLLSWFTSIPILHKLLCQLLQRLLRELLRTVLHTSIDRFR